MNSMWDHNNTARSVESSLVTWVMTQMCPSMLKITIMHNVMLGLKEKIIAPIR